MRTKGKNLARVEQDRLLDEALEQMFPASDPVALQQDLDLIEKRRAVVGYAFLRLCPEPKLYELIGDGHLATTTVGRRRLVVVRSLLSLLEANTST